MNLPFRFFNTLLASVPAFIIMVTSCTTGPIEDRQTRIPVDSVGFAVESWQMDSIAARLDMTVGTENRWRVAISPHDDYTYVGDLYPAVLNGIKAKTVLLFGVAHKARDLGLEDRIIFGNDTSWVAPYGEVKVSGLRDVITERLPVGTFTVSDTMMSVEHSLEALIPFLQYNNLDVEIIPVLVPAMSHETITSIAKQFASTLSELMDEYSLVWGEDIAILITTDAVHYGDDEWGGRNYAPFGTDAAGLAQARAFEQEIIDSSLIGLISTEKIERFVNYTVSEDDHREYKWTWCGRYAVPFGLMAGFELDRLTGGGGLNGEFIGYSSSIDHAPVMVDDIGMGRTAIATNRHWVGYAAVGYGL